MSDKLARNTYFLHIPKTGGNWLRSIIKQSSIKEIKTNKISKHATFDLLVGTNRTKFLNLELKKKIRYFCVVRHPLLWYQSWFSYQHDKGWRNWGEEGNFNDWHCLSALNMPKEDDFNQFMIRINQNSPGFLTFLYHSYVLNSGARFLRNENLRDELLSINREWRLGLSEQLILESDKLNVSTKSPIVWDEKVLKDTIENESSILKKYGYEQSPYDLVKIM